MGGRLGSFRARRRLVAVSDAVLAEVPRRDKEAYEVWGRCIKVYDGDTFTVVVPLGVYGTRRGMSGGALRAFPVRVVGYDSPEIRQPRNAPDREENRRKAEDARERLRALIYGHTLLLRVQGTDKYGRLLADFKVRAARGRPRESIATLMVREGHGLPYYGGTKPNPKPTQKQ